MSTLEAADPGSLANEYIELQSAISELESRTKLVKDNLVGLLPYTEGFKVTYGTAVVQWVKGRNTAKLDERELRKALVQGGVSIELIEEAFAKATTKSVSMPSMRISTAKEGE